MKRKPLEPDYQLPDIYKGDKPLIDNPIMRGLETIPGLAGSLGRGVGHLGLDMVQNPAPYAAGVVGSALLPEAGAMKLAGMGLEALLPALRGLMSYSGYRGVKNDQAKAAGVPQQQIQQEALADLSGFLAPNNMPANAIVTALQSLLTTGSLPTGEQFVQGVGVPKLLQHGGQAVSRVADAAGGLDRRGAVNLMPWREHTINRGNPEQGPQQILRSENNIEEARLTLQQAIDSGDAAWEARARENLEIFERQLGLLMDDIAYDARENGPVVRGPEAFDPQAGPGLGLAAEYPPDLQMRMASSPETGQNMGGINGTPVAVIDMVLREQANTRTNNRNRNLYRSAAFGGPGVMWEGNQLAEPQRTPTEPAYPQFDPETGKPILTTSFDELPNMRIDPQTGRQVPTSRVQSLSEMGLNRRPSEATPQLEPTNSQLWEALKAERPDIVSQALSVMDEETAINTIIPQLMNYMKQQRR